MSIYHHWLAKTTTDSILAKFKSGSWESVDKLGVGFRRVCVDSGFPSPDAAFYDDKTKLMVSFEFKPPTETKRGILTGLGQSIAYLKKSHLSYLVIPQTLAFEGYPIGSYMSDLFQKKIEKNLPIGLIIYENSIPENVYLVHEVKTLSKIEKIKGIRTGRFWAKHQDMSVPLFHLILHCYFLKKTRSIKGDAFAYCWKKHLFPKKVLETLKPTKILGVTGNTIRTCAGTKDAVYFETRINDINLLSGIEKDSAIDKLKHDARTDYVGDNYFNSTKKNLVTFLKHIDVIDSSGDITESGLKLYIAGIVNGSESKVFNDYFTKTILIVGHHLDVICDFDNLCRGKKTIEEVKIELKLDYEKKGMIKVNPNRKVAAKKSTVPFLKFEFILWNSLGLTVKTDGIPQTSFNWKKITEVCSLPDL